MSNKLFLSRTISYPSFKEIYLARPFNFSRSYEIKINKKHDVWEILTGTNLKLNFVKIM